MIGKGSLLTLGRRFYAGGLFLALMILGASIARAATDPRSFNHGIDAVVNQAGGYDIFFSSSGLIPKGEDENGNWTHDIFLATWKPGQSTLAPRVFLGKPEAQEPVDVAETSDGHILLTLEDGWDTWGEVEQRYAVYDNSLIHVFKAYPETVSDGGHSGHTAAVGNRFIIFYSDEWIKGGGVDNLGSGDGVYAKIYDSKGRELHDVPVAPRVREWWPLIAGGGRRALLVWQAFVKGETYATLKFATLDPLTGSFTAPQVLEDGIQYYTYTTAYLPTLDRFVIAGTTDDGRGFAALIDEEGQTLSRIDCMPAIVRETGTAVVGADIFVPSSDNRLLRLHVSDDVLTLTGAMASPLTWSTVGSLGLPEGPGRLRWFSLARTGLQDAPFETDNMGAPTAQDMCHKD